MVRALRASGAILRGGRPPASIWPRGTLSRSLVYQLRPQVLQDARAEGLEVDGLPRLADVAGGAVLEFTQDLHGIARHLVPRPIGSVLPRQVDVLRQRLYLHAVRKIDRVLFDRRATETKNIGDASPFPVFDSS